MLEATFCFNDLPLALISQFVCHNCSVPGFTDGAGFRFGWVRQLLSSVRSLVSEVGTEAALLVCDDVVKTENLDWIFLLDVSLLLRLAWDASVLLSTSGDLTCM